MAASQKSNKVRESELKKKQQHKLSFNLYVCIIYEIKCRTVAGSKESPYYFLHKIYDILYNAFIKTDFLFSIVNFKKEITNHR